MRERGRKWLRKTCASHRERGRGELGRRCRRAWKISELVGEERREGKRQEEGRGIR